MVVGLDDAVGGAALAGDVAGGVLVFFLFFFFFFFLFFMKFSRLLAWKRTAGVVECCIFSLPWSMAGSRINADFSRFQKPHHITPPPLPPKPTGEKNIQIDNLSSFVLHFDGFVESKVDDDDG